MDDAARFRARLGREASGCLVVAGSRRGNGYGIAWVDGRVIYAHRYAFFLAHGRWPSPLCLHHCDNPPCCEPTHLYEGTHAQNAADARDRERLSRGVRHGELVRKGQAIGRKRAPKQGEANPNVRLTAVEVADVRQRYARGETQTSIARRFGVGQPHVSRIIRGVAWS